MPVAKIQELGGYDGLFCAIIEMAKRDLSDPDLEISLDALSFFGSNHYRNMLEFLGLDRDLMPELDCSEGEYDGPKQSRLQEKLGDLISIWVWDVADNRGCGFADALSWLVDKYPEFMAKLFVVTFPYIEPEFDDIIIVLAGLGQVLGIDLNDLEIAGAE